MKSLELKEALSKYLQDNGTESFAKLVSDAIDEACANRAGIYLTRASFWRKFEAISNIMGMELRD